MVGFGAIQSHRLAEVAEADSARWLTDSFIRSSIRRGQRDTIDFDRRSFVLADDETNASITPIATSRIVSLPAASAAEQRRQRHVAGGFRRQPAVLRLGADAMRAHYRPFVVQVERSLGCVCVCLSQSSNDNFGK